MGNTLGLIQETTYCQNDDCITCKGDLVISGKEAYCNGKKIHTFDENETFKNKRDNIPEKLEKYEKEDTKFYFRKNRNVVPETEEVNKDANYESKEISFPFMKVQVLNKGNEEEISVNMPFFSIKSFKKN